MMPKVVNVRNGSEADAAILLWYSDIEAQYRRLLADAQRIAMSLRPRGTGVKLSLSRKTKRLSRQASDGSLG